MRGREKCEVSPPGNEFPGYEKAKSTSVDSGASLVVFLRGAQELFGFCFGSAFIRAKQGFR